jgi:hypothetical protein
LLEQLRLDDRMMAGSFGKTLATFVRRLISAVSLQSFVPS